MKAGHSSAARRVVSIFLAGSFLISLSACKKKKKASETKTLETKVVEETDPFFSLQKKDLSFPFDAEKEIETFQVEDPVILGKLIAVQYNLRYKMTQEELKKYSNMSSDDAWAFYQSFTKSGKALFDMDGNYLRDLGNSESGDEGTNINGFQTAAEGADGKVYAIYNRPSDTGLRSFLCVMSDRGEPDEGVLLNVDCLFSFESQLMVTAEGKILVGSYESLYIFQKDGSLLNNVSCDGFQGNLLAQDGKYYAKGTRNTNPENLFEVSEFIQEIDLSNGKLVGQEIKCTNGNSLRSFHGYSYRLDNNGVKKVDLLNSANDRYVMEWSQTDYDPGIIYFREMNVLSDDEFVFIKHIYGSYETTGDQVDHLTLARLNRMEKNPYAGKPVISIACYGPDNVMDYVVSYNTDANSKNRIILHDYSQDVDPDWPNVQKAASVADTVYQAMLSGNGPDILANFGSFSQFNTDEVLLDLNTLIDDKNSNIRREDYYDNILRAAETNGNLYQIPLTYRICGLLGNADLLGEPTNWDCRAFCEKMKTLSVDLQVFEKMEYKYFFPDLFSYSAKNLIDYEKDQVNFDSDGFRDFLTLMKDYGELSDAYTFYDSWGLYAENLQIFIPVIIENPESYARYMNIRKGNDRIYPMPSVDGQGLSAEVCLSMAISKFSTHQEEAWDFIRFMMEKDEQVRLSSQDTLFPIHKEALQISNQTRVDKFAERQKKQAENGQWVQEYDVTDETAKSIVGLVERISGIRATDPDIMNIILEEAPGYFTGQRTAEDVSKTIQNRATIVVRER